MKDYILALDCGKNTLKAVGRAAEGTSNDIQRNSFRAKMYDLKKGYIDVEGNSHRIELDGESYIVGDQGEENTENFETSKTSLLHKLCAYTAIAKFLEPGSKDNKIYMSLACPLSVLKIDEDKEDYKKFIKGEGPIKVNVDGDKYEFEIMDIVLKAEGSGIVNLHPELFKNTEAAIIDFGGLNMGFSLYVNGSCKATDRFIEQFGANKLTTYVSQDLTTYKHGNIVNYDRAEKALEDGYLSDFGKPDNDSIQAIKESKKRFLQEAINKIERNDYQLGEIKSVIFIGGTTEKLQEVIKEQIPHAFIPKQPQWSTVEGIYVVAYAKYMKTKGNK
ncbi:ParM/StbA family protein [Clostridium botulinum]|nr:ParM/StbA family protein [Clostridium botulinum]